MKSYLVGVLLVMSVSSCGSLSTIPKTNAEVRDDLIKKDTRCSSLYRVYSGVAYDFCRIHSYQQGTLFNANDILLGFYGVDILVSAVADTLALPYTITQQKHRGTIDIQD